MTDEIVAPAAPDGDAPLAPIPTEGADTVAPTEPEPAYLPDPKFTLGQLVFRLNWKPDERKADVNGTSLTWIASEITGIKRLGNHITYSLDREDINWYFEDELALTKEERLQNLV